MSETLNEFHTAIEKKQNGLVKDMLEQIPCIAKVVDPYSGVRSINIAFCLGNTEAQRELKKYGMKVETNVEELKAGEIIYAATSGKLQMFKQWVKANKSSLNQSEILEKIISKLSSRNLPENVHLSADKKAVKNLVAAVKISLANGANPDYETYGFSPRTIAEREQSDPVLRKCARLMNASQRGTRLQRLRQRFPRFSLRRF